VLPCLILLYLNWLVRLANAARPRYVYVLLLSSPACAAHIHPLEHYNACTVRAQTCITRGMLSTISAANGYAHKSDTGTAMLA